MIIHFFVKKRFGALERKSMRSNLMLLFEEEKIHVESVSYIFCSDKSLLKINEKFLNHTDFTDVITFDLSDTKLSIIGEVYISVDRVRDNATLFSVSFINELMRVIIHGALHLCGYKDKTVLDKLQMKQKENFYLKKFRDKSI